MTPAAWKKRGISSGILRPMGETGELFLLISDPEETGELMNCGKVARVHHVSDHPCNDSTEKEERYML